jgi:FSR family fosmidomycin resistance protein-like MFS transporter
LSSQAPDAALPSRDLPAISLVGSAHFLSHFYQLVLPPLFPFLALRYDIGFTELGLIITAFGIASGVAQTPIGFLVDRLGGRNVLVLGLIGLSISIIGYGLASSYTMLIVAAVAGGIANATFHPADYSILSATIPEKRLARAFSYHAVSGNLGWAAAPAVMLGLYPVLGIDGALVAVGSVGLLVATVLATQRHRLRDEAMDRRLAASSKSHAQNSFRSGLHLLKSRPVVMCFVFQTVHSMASGGVRTFGIVGLAAIYGLGTDDPQYALIGTALTLYLITSSVGNWLGGEAIDRTGKPGLVYTVSILGVFVLVVSLGPGAIPLYGVVAVLAIAGVLQGSLLPARDVLVRAISPPGEIGKVFGFTSSGLALGNAIMPPLFGWVLDIGEPSWIFYVSGLFMLGALATYTQTSRHALR